MIRYQHNPIITRTDIPEIKPHLVDVTSVFNPGAVRFHDKYLLLLRVQNRGRETFLLTAESDDGIEFTVNPEMVRFDGIESVTEIIYHIYDPRVTVLDDTCYIMCAMDMDKKCRLGLARTDDFRKFRFMGIVSDKDNRNGVLFPEKIDGKYLRLDRPNRVPLDGGVISGDAICLSDSNDLLSWQNRTEVITGRPHYWDERIGPGPPPIKTAKGWLLVYHGIAEHFGSSSIYQAGVLLLDLINPAIVKARGRYNILEPREIYEQIGQVPNVVFPSGMIVDDYDEKGFARPTSRVLIYYGAADTCVGLAMTTVEELIEACYEGKDTIP
jgi:beta-1,4-mannooligosaccharide/beta-1,4-mannosyl-N-acetylglucosamine phosphorylase